MIDDLTALRLQLDWGADEALGNVALDRFTPALMPAPVARLESPALAASTAAPNAGTLDELMVELAAFEGCALRGTAMQLVRPDGNPEARLVIMGDAPGSDDDRSGRAFSGATGQLVDRVLGTAGFDRRSALLTTLVPWRPPGGRRLSDSEVQSCLPFARRLLAIVRPTHVLLLGALTVRALAGSDAPIRRLRGKWLEVRIDDKQLVIAAMALPTPDQWLSNAAAKQQLWSDLLMLQIAVTTG